MYGRLCRGLRQGCRFQTHGEHESITFCHVKRLLYWMCGLDHVQRRFHVVLRPSPVGSSSHCSHLRRKPTVRHVSGAEADHLIVFLRRCSEARPGNVCGEGVGCGDGKYPYSLSLPSIVHRWQETSERLVSLFAPQSAVDVFF